MGPALCSEQDRSLLTPAKTLFSGTASNFLLEMQQPTHVTREGIASFFLAHVSSGCKTSLCGSCWFAEGIANFYYNSLLIRH